MYQKDYILRLIEEMTKFLAVVFGLMKKGEYQEASEHLEKTYYELLKQDAAYFRKIPQDDLTSDLLKKHNYTNGHLEILAELFNAEAEIRKAKGDIKGNISFSQKSLILYRFVDKELRTYSQERLDKIARIESRIKELGSN